MSHQNSVIQKTIIELQYNGRTDGLALQHQVKEWYSRQLLPQMEKLFDTFSGRDDYIRIDKLELSVALDKGPDWQAEAAGQLNRQLTEALHNKKRQVVSSTQQGISSRTENFWELFLFLLQQGFLPWWSRVQTKEAFMELAEAYMNEEMPLPVQNEFINVLRRENARKRLAVLLPDHLLLKLVYLTVPVHQQGVQAFITDADYLLTQLPEPAKSTFFRLSRLALLQSLAETPFEKAAAGNLAAALHLPGAPEWNTLHYLQLTLRELPAALQKKPAENKQAGPVVPDQPKEAFREVGAEEETEIYISNAGLVLLAPFLPSFFSRLAVYENDRLIHVPLALQLLHFLITGKEDAAEFEYVLPKVFCGVEIAEVTDTPVVLTETHQREAEELLRSVIEHWQILKDTSIKGLREAFLQRNGKLSFRGGTWLLQVEQKAYDVLLHYLPWNIAFIKLPWMKHLMKTEWV